MSRSFGQKQKILLLAKYLLEESDENHTVSVAEMIEYLNSAGISAERKSIYADLETLSAFGMDIIPVKGKKTGYFVGERLFETPELRLLVDAVQSSRFLTRKKSEELIGKLEGLTSRHEGKKLSHQVFVAGRIKTMNESIYRNVDTLSLAIGEDRKIAFRYFEWAPDGSKRLRRDGGFYTVSPFHLVWDDENYYLIALTENGEKRHFRVDKMQDLSPLEEKREGNAAFLDFDPALYEKKSFGMFGGREERVTLWCEERLCGVIFDRFGREVPVRKADGGGILVTVPVFVSPVFYSFVMSFGKEMQIKGPAWVKEEFLQLARDVVSAYEEGGNK